MQTHTGTTPSGHTNAITASRVIGTAVYNTAGDRIGSIEDVMLEKMSNGIMFAVIVFGGFLGISEKYHAVPWSPRDYDDFAARRDPSTKVGHTDGKRVSSAPSRGTFLGTSVHLS